MKLRTERDEMTAQDELLDHMLDTDPLALRLARAEVAPMREGLLEDLLAKHYTTRHWRRHGRRLLVGVAALVAVLSLLAVTPVGATVGRAILPEGLQQRLGLVVGAPQHLVPGGQSVGRNGRRTPAPMSRDKQGDRGGGDLVTPHLSLAEAQRQVAFSIRTPRWLPGSLRFRGALVANGDAVVPNGESVYLHYGDASGKQGLGLWIYSVAPMGGSAVPSSSVQRVRVDGDSAFFSHGSYEDSGPGTVATWNPAADDEELTWQHAGMTYDLTAGGLHLSSNNLIRIAESVRYL